MIYFIKASQSGAIKIGTSNDPRGRFATLQTGSPEPLELIGVMPGQADEERRLHGKFSRFRMHGEWFKGAPELLQEIKRMLCDKGTAEIEDLVDATGSELWLASGAVEYRSGTGDCKILCLRREWVDPARLVPNLNAMLDAVHADARFIEIDMILNVTCRHEHWPEDREILREPLTSKDSLEWAADFASSDQMFPVLTETQKQARRTHPTVCFVVGSPVIHPQYGAGKVLAVHGFGEERRARIKFASGAESTFVLERSPLELTTQMILDAVVAKLAPPPPESEPWRPRWMNPSNS